MQLTHAICLVGICASASLFAQTAPPSAQQMIDMLRAPQTRILPAPVAPQSESSAGAREAAAGTKPSRTRNLVIEQAAPEPQPVSLLPPSAATVAPAAVANAVAALTARPSLSLLIQFDFNSARVRSESQQALTNLAQALQSAELSGFRFAVEGHTDAKGNASANVKLSQQRAQAVRNMLVTQGVAGERLVAQGKGASELANSSDPYAAENRRVRIVNLD